MGWSYNYAKMHDNDNLESSSRDGFKEINM